MPPKYWPKAISIRALMEFAPSWNSRHFYRGGIVQRLSNAAERFIDRDHGYIDGRLRLRHRVLGIELRALRIQQDQKVRDALPVLRVGELRGAARGLRLFGQTFQLRLLCAVGEKTIFGILERRQHDFLVVGRCSVGLRLAGAQPRTHAVAAASWRSAARTSGRRRRSSAVSPIGSALA